jgi:hypothetical protein
MKVFVWKYIDHCSDDYHPEGGVVVFAATEERARELANKEPGCAIRPKEMPDDVRELASESGGECVIIFPDAGCC